MAEAKHLTNLQDLQLMYDLSIYNCLRFDTYKALIYEDPQHTREYTNVELAREATQLAAGLQALGIQKGDRVIMMMPNCPEVIIAYQGIARAGAVVIPVLPLLKATEVHYIAEDSGAKAVITSSLLLPLLSEALANVPTAQHVISTGDVGPGLTDSNAPSQIHAYSGVIARGAAQADAYLSDLEGVTLSP
ncbi:MAG: long-chain fatty acid--CoA ligase, partial [Chloroflexota bacterium]|nr:long-chain fatty acid--CoA ligase [Chloroflexota bacterium]